MKKIKTIPGYESFAFQKDSINIHMQDVIDNNGACIFDETGLGKTVTGATVAINLSEGPFLIVSPVANRNSWKEIMELAGVNYTVCTSAKIPEGIFPFVIVDEAHNFRNIKAKSYLELFKLIKINRSQVLLLTATPFQNKLSELKTMVSLIHFHTNTPAFILLGIVFGAIKESEKKLDTLHRFKGELGDPGFSFKEINTQVETEHKLNHDLGLLANIFATFSHRNTRTDILNKYPGDVSLMGHFPKKHDNVIKYGSDKGFREKFFQTVNLIERAPLCMQNIMNYNPDKPKGQQLLSMGGIMRSFLLKRLDSSVYCFKKSVDNAYNKLVSITKYNGMKEFKMDNEAIQVTPNFWPDCQRDIQIFQELQRIWANETDTVKVDLLFNELKGEKCIIFTEYKDTLDMLIAEADKRGLKKYVGFDGNSSGMLLERIRNNFDANLDIIHNDLTYCFTTDVLAEGVNLHVAREIIHFDQKWNPSRVLQRNGRIDRILRTGVVTDITITSFSVDVVIENILQLEKTINKKQYMADVFLDNLNRPQFHTIPNFINGHVLFYPDHDEVLALNAYRTYAGDVLMTGGLASYLRGYGSPYSDFDPTSSEAKIMNRKTKADSVIPRSIYFKSMECASFLYRDSYEEIFKQRAKLRAEAMEPDPFSKFLFDFELEFKAFERQPYESCVIWTKDHHYMNWS